MLEISEVKTIWRLSSKQLLKIFTLPLHNLKPNMGFKNCKDAQHHIALQGSDCTLLHTVTQGLVLHFTVFKGSELHCTVSQASELHYMLSQGCVLY